MTDPAEARHTQTAGFVELGAVVAAAVSGYDREGERPAAGRIRMADLAAQAWAAVVVVSGLDLARAYPVAGSLVVLCR